MTTTAPIPHPDQLPRPRRVTRESPAVPTVDVFVALVEAGGMAAWALQVDSGTPLAESVTGGHEKAVSAVVGIVADLARLEDARLAVHSASHAVAAQAGGIPGVMCFPVSRAVQDGRRRDVVRRAEEELARAQAAAPRLEVAVDGSWGRGSRAGGYAFLAEDGAHGSGADPGVGAPVVSELRAVRLAVLAMPASRRLVIRSDSRAVLAWLADPNRAHPALWGEVRGLRQLLEGRDVQFSWVKGHSGAGLHDGADRLAVAARRALEAGLGESAPSRQAAQIVAESLAAHEARAGSEEGGGSAPDPAAPTWRLAA